jgi:hypothetical protein
MKKQKIGRNDPCPCGSGRKYKKCCLNKLPHRTAIDFPSIKRYSRERVHEGDAAKASKPVTNTTQKKTKIRKHHYVPIWYQKNFLQEDQKAYHYLDMMPFLDLPDGRRIRQNDKYLWGPGSCFEQKDLYTTRVFGTRNDEIEKYLFGDIDDKGSWAIRSLLAEDWSLLSKYFVSVFEYMDAQILRTPKGLDWIRSSYYQLSQTELMIEMQLLRTMHCAMWAEGIKEIVSAENSNIKFIVSDHPITIYNYACPPDCEICQYPKDPPTAWKASQTLFPLDLNHCLIISNLEYGRDPDVDPLSRRTNARPYAQTMTRWDNIIRERRLNSDEVSAINLIIKRRARKFIASAHPDWLYPENSITESRWDSFKTLLLPSKDKVCEFGGEIFAGGDKGLIWHQDEFGRQHTTHENKNDPIREMSIKERNITLYNAVVDIFKADSNDWDVVRKNVTDDRIKEIYRVVRWLWNPDTEILNLLPKPKDNLSALYSGTIDPRIIPITVLGYSFYVDKIIMFSPFICPQGMNTKFNPIENPSQYRYDTLKIISILLQVIPLIDAGIIEMIPDPCDFDPYLRQRAYRLAETRMANRVISEEDVKLGTRLMKDDTRRHFMYSSPELLRQMIKKDMPELPINEQEKMIQYAAKLRENDLLAPLSSDANSGDGGQLIISRMGGSLEMALFISQLTGSFIYTDVRFRWKEIHSSTLKASWSERHDPWAGVVNALNNAKFAITIVSDPNFIIYIREKGMLKDVIALYKKIFRSVMDLKEYSAAQKAADEIIYIINQINTNKISEMIQREYGQHKKNVRLGDSNINRVDMPINHHIPFGGIGMNAASQLLLSYGFNSPHLEFVPYSVFMDLDNCRSSTINPQ